MTWRSFAAGCWLGCAVAIMFAALSALRVSSRRWLAGSSVKRWRAGNGCFISWTAATKRTLRGYVDFAGIDSARWLASGRLQIRSASEVYEAPFDPERQIAHFEAETRAARAEGFDGLAAMGEMSWARGDGRAGTASSRMRRAFSASLPRPMYVVCVSTTGACFRPGCSTRRPRHTSWRCGSMGRYRGRAPGQPRSSRARWTVQFVSLARLTLPPPRMLPPVWRSISRPVGT